MDFRTLDNHTVLRIARQVATYLNDTGTFRDVYVKLPGDKTPIIYASVHLPIGLVHSVVFRTDVIEDIADRLGMGA